MDGDGQAELRKRVGLSTMETLDALDPEILDSLVEAGLAVRRTVALMADREIAPVIAQSLLLGAVLSTFTHEYGA